MSQADSHLTYIGVRSRGWGESARYDVYGRSRGLQLGSVVRLHLGGWEARAEDGTWAHGRTRWEAATAVWPS